MKQNDRQVGGEHYKTPIQHWDYVWANDLDYFQAQIIKYVTRWKAKNGLEDLAKARHFLEKYMELQLGIEAADETNAAYADSDMCDRLCSCNSRCDPHHEDCPYYEDNPGEPMGRGYVSQD